MAETAVGLSALHARFAAISSAATSKAAMQGLALATVREAKLLVPRRTGNLGRSIHVTTVTETTAEVVASARYASFVEFGTRPHEITPNAKKALRWAASASGRRLTGSPTKAAQRGAQGGVVFATRVHHPGTRAEPYLLPGAKKAVSAAGLLDPIVNAWNSAA
jgi:hypothetical protein